MFAILMIPGKSSVGDLALIFGVDCLWEMMDILILALPLTSYVIMERTELLCIPISSSVNATTLICTKLLENPMRWCKCNCSVNSTKLHHATWGLVIGWDCPQEIYDWSVLSLKVSLGERIKNSSLVHSGAMLPWWWISPSLCCFNFSNLALWRHEQ